MTPAQTPLGSTPAQINANFPVMFAANMRKLKATGGDAAVYKFLWGLSAFQYYELEGVYAATAKGHTGIPLTLWGFFEYPTSIPYLTSTHAAINRLVSVNLMYNSMVTVPGGRRAVMKLPGDIGGFPPTATLYEVYLYFASMEGVNAGQALALTTRTLAPEAAIWFGGSYGFGTVLSWWIQTYDPALQEAIGNDIGAVIDGVGFTVAVEVQLQQQIETIDTMGSPGLNDIDFDGIQLGAEYTSGLLP